ncbi:MULTISPECIES: cold-shock protein [Pedobacter]|jgi:cold shock CspA family protein|uniref:Cold shock protein, CspA family n=4 Tax=Pedobacter TaxID=84567 RepID=A0A1G8CEG4_9SPHI|nr:MULTISPECIES: cold shock domain-containing protein [Pedobacter]ARS42567.1 DNA-binding protein [Sphingobacteriaceae bacterium GW460-11-11-14-LB5]MDQ0968249.1 cold shock CspA family protein [Flavobacterium sp. W4I14]KRT17087.1 DNA-binding protein [Pedobacter ginsenosidimutans]MBE5319559.1 cold shock domain-containing protein [Pedobacter sp. MR2016-19]MCX2495140.1 cold shock domain-containing protein [Pedobacter sp. PF22-3]|eukprot:TRINITY_DN32539_c0_g1_i2.p1 TRINITY_DN32539_c0_g1~~TRINITY_DN32539_c0_g1_i2.p1  ORF type:complete len:151 (-),score=7.13 TRINITY_DN32539_c0_g1_i2:135-587(-)
MAKSQATYSKKENEKKRLKKQKDKQEKKEERQANAKKGLALEDMMAYVDENGNISSTPPDPKKKKVINTEDIQIGISRQEDIIDENPVKKGTVTFFNDSKGYGFIKNTETQDSIFVHANGLITQIKEGDKVTFEVEMGQKGPTAVKVSKV